MSRLACLRHGESENVVSRQAGALPGARLTARGRDQAAAAAIPLRDWQADAIYASDAVRSQETAAIIAGALHLDVTVLPALAEVGLGTAEGATDAGTWRCVVQVLQAWLIRGDLGPRVADGESGHEVTGRVGGALAGIAGAAPGPGRDRGGPHRQPGRRSQRAVRERAVPVGRAAAARRPVPAHPGRIALVMPLAGA